LVNSGPDVDELWKMADSWCIACCVYV